MLASGEQSDRAAPTTPQKITFVEVAQPVARMASVEIVVTSGCRVRVSDDFELATLQRVLVALGVRS